MKTWKDELDEATKLAADHLKPGVYVGGVGRIEWVEVFDDHIEVDIRGQASPRSWDRDLTMRDLGLG